MRPGWTASPLDPEYRRLKIGAQLGTIKHAEADDVFRPMEVRVLSPNLGNLNGFISRFARRIRLKPSVMGRDPSKKSASLEEQVSDLGHERAQFLAKLADEERTITDQKRQLPGQEAVIAALKAKPAAGRHPANGQEVTQPSREVALQRDQELATAQVKLTELKKTIDALAGQRDEIASHAAVLQVKVGDLTQLVRDRELELEQKEDQVAKDQDLLEHDRDIRELIGARDLYIAEIHDVIGIGETNKTYGRIFYTRGKRLVFYAYDLDAQHSLQQASSFQAWGRRGPNK